MRLNLGCGLVLKEGWVNIDKMALPGVDRQINLFRFPWPIATNSVDEIFASHLIEHIPHEARLADWPTAKQKQEDGIDDAWVREILELDGFYAFFAECWRIMKPNATISIVCPHGQSRWALQDATHHRSIVPNTFCYLTQAGNQKKTFDYGLPFLFEITQQGCVFAEYKLDGDLTIEKFNEAEKMWNSIIELNVTLRAVKE